MYSDLPPEMIEYKDDTFQLLEVIGRDYLLAYSLDKNALCIIQAAYITPVKDKKEVKGE